MATYAIGDVQGCFIPLQKLLDKINFDPQHDSLWFTGDLINRGKNSLSVLKFIKNLGEKAIAILGNHDLHFLAVAANIIPISPKDTFQDVLNSSEANDLFEWIRHRPLIHYDQQLNYLMVHAGLAPQWDLSQALNHAKEVEQELQSDRYKLFLAHMYGNEPKLWKEELTGWERLRVITNYLTRMRYLGPQGELDLSSKGPIGSQKSNSVPWFKFPQRRNTGLRIIFGHWAALQGNASQVNIFAIDTGCVWGNCLTAFCLDNQIFYKVNCANN